MLKTPHAFIPIIVVCYYFLPFLWTCYEMGIKFRIAFTFETICIIYGIICTLTIPLRSETTFCGLSSTANQRHRKFLRRQWQRRPSFDGSQKATKWWCDYFDKILIDEFRDLSILLLYPLTVLSSKWQSTKKGLRWSRWSQRKRQVLMMWRQSYGSLLELGWGANGVLQPGRNREKDFCGWQTSITIWKVKDKLTDCAKHRSIPFCFTAKMKMFSWHKSHPHHPCL